MKATQTPSPRLKTAIAFGAVLALIVPSHAADITTLAARAETAAADLPSGCIVTAEQDANGAPVFSVAGKQEPPGVPPEKVIFEIGSISKVFTGILLAQAVIEKRLTLGSTLREVMGQRQTFADPNVAAITMLQLATHTSGLPRIPDDLAVGSDPLDPYAHYDRAHLDAYLAKVYLDHAPPYASSYSNLGVGLLGDLLARSYGKTWEELVVERIAKPLGMPDTCVTLTSEQTKRFAPAYAGEAAVKPWIATALAGAGALRSTAADMLKFGQALARPGSTPLKASIELIEQPRAGGDIGLCLAILKLKTGAPAYWFAGGTGGFRSWISARPGDSRIVAMLINNSALSPESVISGTSTESPKQPASPAAADATLADYAGDYDTGIQAIHYSFEARGSELWMQITGQQPVQLSRHATAKDRFEFKPVKAEIQFTRRGGKVVSTTLFQAGMEIKAKKLTSHGK